MGQDSERAQRCVKQGKGLRLRGTIRFTRRATPLRMHAEQVDQEDNHRAVLR
jgi:hypothetical protein